jgi:hypothetical protein
VDGLPVTAGGPPVLTGPAAVGIIVEDDTPPPAPRHAQVGVPAGSDTGSAEAGGREHVYRY